MYSARPDHKSTLKSNRWTKPMNKKEWQIFWFIMLLLIVLFGTISLFTDLQIVWIPLLISWIIGFIISIKYLYIVIRGKTNNRNEEFDNSKTKELIKKNLHYIIILIIVISSMYWIFVRPVFIRKNCNNKAFKYSTRYSTKGYYNKEDYTNEYSLCLHSNGL